MVLKLENHQKEIEVFDRLIRLPNIILMTSVDI